MIKTVLAIAGLVLFLVAVLAALVTGFSAAAWVIPVAGACTAGAVTLELFGKLERMRRIELPSDAWKAPALPLSYIRILVRACTPSGTRPHYAPQGHPLALP